MIKLGGVAVFGFLLLVLLAGGCGQTTSTSSGLTGLQAIAFYNEASQITPVFTPSARIAAASDWESGNTMYQVFYALREYIHVQDSGVDRANLYRLLYDVEDLFGAMTTEVVALSSPQVITPPFDFKNRITYEAAVNYTASDREKAAAMITSGTVTKGIVTWIWREASDPNHNEYGVLEATMDNSTKDLSVDFIFCVDYDASDTACDYNNRTRIVGNTGTHAFEFVQTIQTIGGATLSSSLVQIVGKGVSKGAGKNFLLKVKSDYSDGFNTPLYLVVSAEANEDTLKNFNVSSEADADAALLPATVEDYKDFVTTTAFFELTDLLTDVANLNSGNPKQGTIYLNY